MPQNWCRHETFFAQAQFLLPLVGFTAWYCRLKLEKKLEKWTAALQHWHIDWFFGMELIEIISAKKSRSIHPPEWTPHKIRILITMCTMSVCFQHQINQDSQIKPTLAINPRFAFSVSKDRVIFAQLWCSPKNVNFVTFQPPYIYIITLASEQSLFSRRLHKTGSPICYTHLMCSLH